MEIVCPKCEKKYDIEPHTIPPGVTAGKCRSCGQRIELTSISRTTQVLPENNLKKDPNPTSIPAVETQPRHTKASAPLRGWLWSIGGLLAGMVLGIAVGPKIIGQDLGDDFGRVAKIGDSVVVHYTGKLADGSVFDTTKEGDPRRFTIGDGTVISGFEQVVTGMRLGETKHVRIAAGQAFGPYRKDKILQIDREKVPANLLLKVGERIKLKNDSELFSATVVALSDGTVTVDANHPLSGKEVAFEISLVELIKHSHYKIEASDSQ